MGREDQVGLFISRYGRNGRIVFQARANSPLHGFMYRSYWDWIDWRDCLPILRSRSDIQTFLYETLHIYETRRTISYSDKTSRPP